MGTSPLWNYSPKLIILVRSGENTSYKPKLQRSSQNAWPILFKAVKIMEDKKKKKNCHRLEETEENNNKMQCGS